LELYLVRHGETLGNRQKLFYGRKDYALNERGREQAKRVATELKKLELDAIYTSPLKRAIETATAIAHFHPYLDIGVMDELSEMDFGLWEGLSHQEIAKEYPREWETWCRDWWETMVPQGESALQVHQRVTDCLNRIIKACPPDGRIAVISHHGCLRSAITHILGVGMESYWRFAVEPGGIVKINIVEGFSTLVFANPTK
jgi:alpha-ribazole phosphatase